MEVYKWAFYLEHSQSIELDADRAPEKLNLIQFFPEGRQPSVEAQIEYCRKKLDNWDTLVEKSDQ